jgi:surface antigen
MVAVASPLKRRLIAGAAAGALILMSLGGCESVERYTGLSKNTQIGAATGAAVVGVLALIVDANTGWIGASAILGAIAGGLLASQITEDEQITQVDAVHHGETQYNALEHLNAGETLDWYNEESGHSGSTTVNEVFELSNGTPCKNFTETIQADGGAITKSATACRTPAGNWEVRDV